MKLDDLCSDIDSELRKISGIVNGTRSFVLGNDQKRVMVTIKAQYRYEFPVDPAKYNCDVPQLEKGVRSYLTGKGWEEQKPVKVDDIRKS